VQASGGLVGYLQAALAASQEEVRVRDFRREVVKFRTTAPDTAENTNVYRPSRFG